MQLLEREPYLAQLEAALVEVEAGEGRIALVSGEAGIGKTTLVERFIQKHTAETRVLRGVCDSLFTPRPLGPVHDMAAQIGGDLAQQLASDAKHSAILVAFLRELQGRPTIIVFEDVHWADEATLDLLRFVARRITQTLALLVLTYRDDELGPQHPLRSLLGDLASSPFVYRLLLPPLSEQAVHVLVEERSLDASALHQLTGGNPFFLSEVLANPAGGIPSNVRDAVLARAARLSRAGWSVLEAAAVIGLRIEPWLLAQACGAEIQASDECIAAGMLLPLNNVLAFRHELVRQTILEMISPPRKLVLHQQVLEALKSSPTAQEDPARLAHHAGAAGDRQAVLLYALEAASRASAASAHRDAAALYTLALRFADDLPAAEHAVLLEDYSRECNLTEHQSEAITARKQALKIWEELENPFKQGESLAFMTIMLRNNGDNHEAEQVSRAAIELLEAHPPSRALALAYRTQATLRLSNRDYQEAIHWGEQAIQLAERFSDSYTQAMAHIAVGSAWLFLDYPRGHAYLEERRKIALQAGEERQIANLLAYAGSCSVELYEFESAARYLAEGLEYTAERNLDIFYRFLRSWQALMYVYQGRWEAAITVTNHLMQSLSFPAISRITALTASGLLRACLGDPGANQALAEALEQANRTGTLQYLGMARTARAQAAWLEGDMERTRLEARAAYDLALSKKHPWFTGELAYWRWKSGEEIAVPAWVAPPFALQIAGDWRAAAEAWERLDCPYQQARALAEGDLAAQIQALEVFERLGALPAAEKLRDRLQAAGAQHIPPKPRTSTRENPFGLTDRQVEILSLLTEDLSNAEIAERLHISTKTADHHVSAVLAKLDVHSRQEAAERARGHPYFKK
jgi:ATP/maltotriose-dependent transcriptional regulator MalT